MRMPPSTNCGGVAALVQAVVDDQRHGIGARALEEVDRGAVLAGADEHVEVAIVIEVADWMLVARTASQSVAPSSLMAPAKLVAALYPVLNCAQPPTGAFVASDPGVRGLVDVQREPVVDTVAGRRCRARTSRTRRPSHHRRSHRPRASTNP